jgi:hypothetical protein
VEYQGRTRPKKKARCRRVGEIEEAAGVYAERKIEELAERKLRFEKPELTLNWDKIQHRERQAGNPASAIRFNVVQSRCRRPR